MFFSNSWPFAPRASAERRPTSPPSDASFIESDEIAMPGAFAAPSTPSPEIFYPDLTSSLQRRESWVITEIPGDESSTPDVISLSSFGSEGTPSPPPEVQMSPVPEASDNATSSGVAPEASDNSTSSDVAPEAIASDAGAGSESESDYDEDGSDELVAAFQAFDMSDFDKMVVAAEEYLLGGLPFWAQYEATRYALHCGVGLSNTELSQAFATEIEQLQAAYKAKDLQRSWYTIMGRVAARYPPVSTQPRVSATLWSFLQKEKWGKTVCMTGSLQFNHSPDTPAFALKLNPLSTQPSNRFWRKWGSDRFLTIRLPSFNSKLPNGTPFAKKEICRTSKGYNEAVFNFFTKNDGIELLGRIWKLFFVFDSKDKKGNQAVLFAVRGEGIMIEQEYEVEDLLNWHIPLVSKNLESTVPKLWSRISLGFTKTTPSVQFTPDQISPGSAGKDEPYIPDENVCSGNDREKIMDDGCCIASPAVFRQIQKLLGLKEAPTAVQGRIGPSKGLWFVCPTTLREVYEGKRDPDELWIRVNKSQYKYQTHQELHLDPAWTMLDFHSCSHPPKPATVNLQLLGILEHRGVPFEPLRDYVEKHLDTVFQELYSAIHDPVLLRDWIYQHNKLSDSRTKSAVAFQGACPVSPAEKLVMLIDGGFSPQEHPYLMSEQKRIMEGFWKSFREKMKIAIPLSTVLFCVADPTGTLKEGEVSLHFSKGIEDPRTGIRRGFVEGDILVARNPALLPSDIQKVRAVNNEHLRELTDVIFFSTQGSRSLASFLSGGDYDGDKVWICWDQQIVDPFRRVTQVYEKLEAKVKEEWFGSNKERVKELKLEPLRPSTAPKSSKLTVEQRQIARAFIRAGALYTLNSESNQLGIYSKTHLRFSRERGLAHPVSIRLALLCSNLVDAPKQGLILKKDHGAIAQAMFKRYNYKDNPRAEVKPADPDDKNATIIARLDGFAQDRIAKMRRDFENGLPKPQSKDLQITELARSEATKAKSDSELANSLKHLGEQLAHIQDKWKGSLAVLNQREMNSSTPGGLQHYSSQLSKEDSFSNKVETLYAEYANIKPIPEGQTTSHPIISRWLAHADQPNSEWQLLKASRAFENWGGSSGLVWYMAAQQLCELKVRATGAYRSVQESVHLSLRADKRFLRFRREQGGLEWNIEDHDNDYDDVLELEG